MNYDVVFDSSDFQPNDCRVAYNGSVYWFDPHEVQPDYRCKYPLGLGYRLVAVPPNFYRPGRQLDGNYEGRSEDGRASIVVIRQHCVIEVHEFSSREAMLAALATWPQPSPPPRDRWCPQAWERFDDKVKRAKLASAKAAANPATAADAVNEYVRQKLRETGIAQLLFGNYDPRPDLTAVVQPHIYNEFQFATWAWGIDQLRAAIVYRCRKVLKQQDLWHEGEYRERCLVVAVPNLGAGDLAVKITQLRSPQKAEAVA